METYCAKCGVRLIRDWGGWMHAASLDVNTRHKPRPIVRDAINARDTGEAFACFD